MIVIVGAEFPRYGVQPIGFMLEGFRKLFVTNIGNVKKMTDIGFGEFFQCFGVCDNVNATKNEKVANHGRRRGVGANLVDTRFVSTSTAFEKEIMQ